LQALVLKVLTQEAEWITLPEDGNFDLDEVLDMLLDSSFGD
jgi:hypothetical protein